MNYRMQEKIQQGEAIDISNCSLNVDGDYILDNFIEGMDYCDFNKQIWIWSIGKHKETGQILASHSTKYYENSDYECIWLR